MFVQVFSIVAALLSAPVTESTAPSFELAVRSGVAIAGYEVVNVAPGVRTGKYTISPFFSWRTDGNACNEPLDYGGSFWGKISCEKGTAELAGLQFKVSGTSRFRPSFGIGAGWYKRVGKGIEENIRYHGADDPSDGIPYDWRFTKLEEGFFGYVGFAPEYAINANFHIAAEFQAGLGRPYVIAYNGDATSRLDLAKQLYPIASAGLRLSYTIF